MQNKDKLNKKVALVTGASRGIGRAIATEFAKRGAKVCVHYRTKVEDANQTLAGLEGSGHVALQADISKPTEAQNLVERAVNKLGGIDILVNNAGIYDLHPIAETSYEDWQESWRRNIDTNLLGPANLIYLAAKQMKKAGGGRIINVSSRGAFRGEPEAPAYGAAKAGLNALAGSMAKALAKDDIIVTTVAPGFVETEMAAEILASNQGDEIRAQSPLNRAAKPEEVAEVVTFLATTDATYLTGAIIDINGASYLRS